MSQQQTFVIVGANACGGTAAAALREEGFDGRVILIGDERHPPYERPPLSKEYLRGEQPLDKGYLRPADWYEEQNIETRFGTRAERLDPQNRQVILEGGEAIDYDAVLIATGVRNRRLGVPGSELSGILELRKPLDADSIRRWADKSLRVVLVGMGFIGAEVASSLRQMRKDVTVVELYETALYRVLGRDIGKVIEEVHRDHGARMVFNDTVEEFRGHESVEEVVTKEGQRIPADFVVVGIGTVPNTDIVEGTGVEVDNGILVDATLRTNAPGVFAAGDVANHQHPVFGRVRVEHFDNAIKMGPVAARNMMGAQEDFDDPHWFWSDQYDSQIQMGGIASSWDEIVFRGKPQDRSFAAFYILNEAIIASFSLDWKRDVRRSLPLIAKRTLIDRAELRNPEYDLRKMAEGGQ